MRGSEGTASDGEAVEPAGGSHSGDGPGGAAWAVRPALAPLRGLPWGFTAFFVGYAAYYLLHLALNSAVPGLHRGPLLLLSFAPNILLGLVPLVLSWWRGRGPTADFGLIPAKRDITVGLLCGAAALVGSWLLSLVLVGLVGPPPQSELTDLQAGGRSVWLLLFAVFAFAGAPLTEELLLRGALWGALEHHRVPRCAVLVLTALVFAFVHQEPWRLPILFSAGIALGTARMITGRLATSVVAHATNNLLPAVALFLGAH